MNKIIVVGHPQSGFQTVKNLLVDCGMAEALPSRREDLTALEITKILCQAHDIPLFDQEQLVEQLNQIEVAPLWHSMALDLMLGNINQQLWGWADSQVIYLLDYWKSLDPKFVFVFVYDSPESVLLHVTAESYTTEIKNDVESKLKNWCVYNAAVLNFCLQNPERSLLVHSQQVLQSVPSYLRQIRKRVDVPLHMPSQEGLPKLGEQQEHNKSFELSNVKDADDQSSTNFDLLSLPIIENNEDDFLARHLAQTITQTHTDVQHLYEQLQHASNMPLKDIDAKGDIYKAWQSMLMQQRQAGKDRELIEQEKQAIEQEKQAVEAQLTATLAVNNDLMTKWEQINNAKKEQIKLANERKVQIEQLKLQLAEISKKSSESVETDKNQESKLLLGQLHRLHEQLEEIYLENRNLKQLVSVQKPKLYGAADRVKRDLPYRVGSTIIQHSRNVKGLVALPRALFSEIQAFKKETKDGVAQPPLAEYQDVAEAEKVKHHLSYRLGSTLVEKTHNPFDLLVLPIELLKQVNEFKSKKQSK